MAESNLVGMDGLAVRKGLSEVLPLKGDLHERRPRPAGVVIEGPRPRRGHSEEFPFYRRSFWKPLVYVI